MASGIDLMRKTIREKEPLRPSTRLTQEIARARATGGCLETDSGPKPTVVREASSRRLLEVKELIPQLRGDLDWVIMKCLEKDRKRRYETANGLAADLQRYRRNEPVVARPPTPLYRFQKMVRRHKFAVGSASAVAAALMVGFVVAASQAVRATTALRDAQRAKQSEQQQAVRARSDRQSMTVCFASHHDRRDPPQFLVNQWQQLIRGALVLFLHTVQDHSELTHESILPHEASQLKC